MRQTSAKNIFAPRHAMWVRVGMAVSTGRALIWTNKYPATGQERNF
ncbi:MAG TPA: hypothetical protein VM680_14270 [Verrucomicrobiae bacterium]|nr:hypothetical protein [Verrucomicrobiae bacterium]